MQPKCVALLFFTLFSISGLKVQAQSSQFRYAYIERSRAGATITYVVPGDPNSNSVTLDLPIPEGYFLLDAKANPGGDTLAISVQKYLEDRLIFLYDIDQRLSVTLVTLDEIDEDNPIAYLYAPLWSPNGEYLAFIGTEKSGGVLSTYVYSLTNNFLTRLAIGSNLNQYTQAFPYDLAWSPNNTKLAIMNLACRGVLCSNLIEVFSIPGLNYITSISPNFIEANGYLCNPEWSPSGTYIAFSLMCYDVDTFNFHEIYIWNTIDGDTFPLTNYTTPPNTDRDNWNLYSSYYDYDWISDNSVLVGIATSPYDDASNLVVKTSAFQISPKTETALFSNQAAYDWAINPVSDEVAYRSISISGTEVLDFNVENAFVEIADFNGESLKSFFKGKPGCDLSWSPDGATLAYLNDGEFNTIRNSCISPQEIVFVNKATEQIQEIALPQAGILIVGWVKL